MIAGGTCITFSSVSLLTWGVDFAVTYKDFSLRQASVSLAVIGLVCSLAGVLMGGFVADRLQRRFAFGRIIAIAVALLLAAPFLLLAIQTDDQALVLAGLALAAFFMSWYHGPVTAVIHDMMPRRAHATSIGVYMFVTQLVGGFGPQFVGRISDLHDMQFGLQIAVAVMVAGGLLMFLVIHFIRRDGLKHQCLSAFHVEPGDELPPLLGVLSALCGEIFRYLIPICSINRSTSWLGNVVERPLVFFLEPLAQVVGGDKAGFAVGQVATGTVAEFHESRVGQPQHDGRAIHEKFSVDGVAWRVAMPFHICEKRH